MSRCDDCIYFDYDEYEDYYYCTVNLDEDEMFNFITDNTARCPYYRFNDEYELARKQ